MKIAVYALCKNEIDNVKDWYESCKDADLIVVTDTGSTDGSLEALSHLPVELKQAKIIPWRFDDAFNIALCNLPEDVDICIRLDFDERLRPGWKEALLSVWQHNTTRLRYPYVWNWNKDGTPDREWYGDRIHSRKDYRWSGATHEGLYKRSGNEVEVYTESLRIDQFHVVKPRPNDITLLEEEVRDNPTNSRMLGYLAREYYFINEYDKAIDVYHRFLNLNPDLQELIQAYCYLAKCDKQNEIKWLDQAIQTTGIYREPYMDLALIYYRNSEWDKCLAACENALKIVDKPNSYICLGENYTWLPHDLLSISHYHLGNLNEAVHHSELAVKYSPEDKRLTDNLALIKNAKGY